MPETLKKIKTRLSEIDISVFLASMYIGQKEYTDINNIISLR
jgi:hypothetical protein